MSDFKASDLQTAKYNSGFAMSHRMGLAIIDMTTGKSVPSTATWTYNKNDGTYTESGTESSDAHTIIYPYHGFNETTSSGYSIPLNSDIASTDCYYIVKSTSATASTSVKFGCDTEETKEYWTDVTISDIGYGKCHSETIASDREFASLIALFSCVRTCQTITLPWYDSYKMECWGAQGGTFGNSVGGYGGYSCGNISLEKGLSLYIYVGSAATATAYSSGEGIHSPGGWNGGGYGVLCSSQKGYGGGGATDIRIKQHSESDGWSGLTSLGSRIIVASGGGGGGQYRTNTYSGLTGPGGGVNGYDGKDNGGSPGFYGLGGQQEKGGSISTGYGGTFKEYQYLIPNMICDGSFGKGGNDDAWQYMTSKGDGGPNDRGGPGGGSGWYGGGAGYRGHAGGGGGSSFVSGHAGCSGYNNTTNAHTGVGNSSVIDGRPFTFTTSELWDGKGYKWNSSAPTSTLGFPKTSGSGTENGHSGNGYAKITSL